MDKEKRYELNLFLLILCFWVTLWYVYNRFLVSEQFDPMKKVLVTSPKWLSCAIPYTNKDPTKDVCDTVHFDGWTIGHICIYASIGSVFPTKWKEALFLSIANEVIEYAVGWRARWLIDPLTNMIGFYLGSCFPVHLEKYELLYETNITVVLISYMAGLFYLNRPSMLHMPS